MARMIHGRIADQDGRPIGNAKIEAWDSDWPDEDDRMGVVYTEADGSYELQYGGGHWDPAPHNITTWRPDIYVTASLQNNNGEWVKSAKSKIYEDHKLAQDLKIDLTIPISQVIAKRTMFQISQFAFQFANSFSIKGLIPAVPGNWRMGLCGGMSAAALHRFNHKCAVPTDTTTPQTGSSLYNELLERQVATLASGVLAKIYDWMRSPDLPHVHTPESIRHRQKVEWPVLQSYINQGKPAILCLIRAEGYIADISNNHQVLAIGYEYASTTRDLKVEIYDPNDKGGSNYLVLSLSGGRLGAHQIDSAGSRINFRGFFVLNTTEEAAKKHYS